MSYLSEFTIPKKKSLIDEQASTMVKYFAVKRHFNSIMAGSVGVDSSADDEQWEIFKKSAQNHQGMLLRHQIHGAYI